LLVTHDLPKIEGHMLGGPMMSMERVDELEVLKMKKMAFHFLTVPLFCISFFSYQLGVTGKLLIN
jgi:hypothetical protein